jgi:hypothetical protein
MPPPSAAAAAPPSAADAEALAAIHRATTDALAEAHARLEQSERRRRSLESRLEELLEESPRRQQHSRESDGGEQKQQQKEQGAEAAAAAAAAADQQQQRLLTLESELEASQERAAAAARAAAQWQSRFLSERLARRALHERLQQLRGNVRVAVRVRPCLIGAGGGTANAAASGPTFSFPPLEGSLVLRLPADNNANANNNASASTREFEFDSVFPPECPQRRVFEAEALPLVRSVADGHSACVLAYGATGGGKTHTMMGGGSGGGGDGDEDEQRGLVSRALRELFRLAREDEEHEHDEEKQQQEPPVPPLWRFDVACYEVYNDQVFDLLPGAAAATQQQQQQQQQQQPPQPLDVCGLPAGELPPGVDRVQGLQWRPVASAREVETLLARATARRATAATGVHSRSSRSHAVVTVRIARRQKRAAAVGAGMATTTAIAAAPSPRASVALRAGGLPTTPTATPRAASARLARAATTPLGGAATPPRAATPTAAGAASSSLAPTVAISFLHLVDLAGSERNDRTGIAPSTPAMRESITINRSLSALQDVVLALQQRGGGQQSAATTAPHIPFRNSKLTSVLQDALCGSGKVLLVACVAPEAVAMAESLCTLSFAQRAAQVELGGGGAARAAVASPRASARRRNEI